MTEQKCVLVTGGAGYVGSHVVLELVQAGYNIVVLDNNSFANAAIERAVQDLTGRSITTYTVDIMNPQQLQEVFCKHKFFAVVHLAGLKAVRESHKTPLPFYRINVCGTFNILELMEAHNIHNVIFSSSSKVYGDPSYLPLDEKHPAGQCTNPYGKTKYIIEEALKDMCSNNKCWNAVVLRYFNPTSAHESGKIGENHQGVPINLLPFICHVAAGQSKEVKVFGSDYDTPDGTAIKDYTHVTDLAQGHVAALTKLQENCGYKVYNMGTGRRYSVLNLISAFEKITGKKVPVQMDGRKEGEIGCCYSDSSLAEQELGWKATRNIEQMCRDLWNWQTRNS